MTAIRGSLAQVNIESARWAVTSVVPRRPDQRPLLAGISRPVLVVAGAEDATFPVQEVREMAGAIPGAGFAVLGGVAHLAALESPDAVIPLIEAFLAEQE
jgi:3-oxoadipate enol-lactonase